MTLAVTVDLRSRFITKTAPEDPMMGEEEADLDGAAIASLERGTMQVLLPGEDVKFSAPADVGGGYEAFQYRTLLAVSASPDRCHSHDGGARSRWMAATRPSQPPAP